MRVMFLGGQQHATERDVDAPLPLYVPMVKTPQEFLTHARQHTSPYPHKRSMEYEVETYRICQVGRETYIAILEELL
jgi:hypothetical protein